MKAFVSYSTKDRGFVIKLASDLKKKGVQIWLDEWEIKVGDEIRQKIEHGIAEYDYFIIVLSKDSVISTWVEKELNAAFMKEVSENRIVILPVLVDECKIPPLISGKKYADFTHSYQKGFHDLGRVLAPFPIEIPRITFRNVLVIDDDVILAQTVADILKGLGFSVSVATTLEAGMELARRYQPDCVLTDIWIHPEFGTARGGLLDKLRSLSPRSRLIGMTGDLHLEDVVKNLFDTILIKPIGIDALISAIDTVCTKDVSLRENENSPNNRTASMSNTPGLIPEQEAGPPPKIEITLTKAAWVWNRELDLSAGGEDWDTLDIEVSFVVRNTGTPVSLVEEEAIITGLVKGSRKVKKLVDSANQAEIDFSWTLYDEYYGFSKENFSMLPKNPSEGKLTLRDSLGNVHTYYFEIPEAPRER